MRVTHVFVVCLVALALAACAPGANDQAHSRARSGLEAGFWRGLWHGIIAPVTFVVSLFSSGVGVYEVHNSGHWYDFGFLVGMLCHHGGGAAGRNLRRSRPTPPVSYPV